MKKRVVFRIQLTPEAKRRLGDVSDRWGTTQIQLTSRLVEWFAGQPEGIQVAVLGLYPDDIKRDIAKLILERMANDKDQPSLSRPAERDGVHQAR